MKHFLEMLRDLGPAGLFVLALLDSAGIPVVSGVDVLLVWISIAKPESAYAAAGMALVGSVIGSVVLFYIARKGGEAYLDRFTQKPRGARLRRWFQEYGLLTIFVPALIPIPMPLKVFVLSAGALGISPVAFTLVLIAARIPRYLVLAWMGLRLGADTSPYLRQHIWQMVGLAVGLFVALYLLVKYLDRRRKLQGLVSK